MTFGAPDRSDTKYLKVTFSERAKGAEKASCGETVVQTGVLGESVSSLPP